MYNGKGEREIKIVGSLQDRVYSFAGKAYLTVSSTAPLFGIWSPAKKNAPFVCIEPWYGRCDKEGFNGDLTQREYGNCLEANEQFEQQYTISI